MARSTLAFFRRLAAVVTLTAVVPSAGAAVVSLSDPVQDSFGDWAVSAALDSPIDVLGITLDLSIVQLDPAVDILSGLVLTKQINPIFAPDTGSSASNVFLASIVEQASGTIVTWQLKGLPGDSFRLALTLTGEVAEGGFDEFGELFEGPIAEIEATSELNTLPIPEPGTYALLAAGLALLAWVRRGRMA